MDALKVITVISAAPWSALLMVRPRILTTMVIFLSLFQLSWFTRYSGAPAVLNRASLALAGLLGIRLALDFALKRNTRIPKLTILNPVLLLTCFFIALTISSNLYNGESMVLGIYELRYYFYGFVTCFGLYFYFFDTLTLTFFKKAMIWFGLIQIPFSIIKWLALGSSGRQLSLDSVTGTFGGYGELTACQIFTISIVLFEELSSQKKIIRLNNYPLCFLLLVPLLLSSAATATVFLALSVGFVWYLSALYQKNAAIIVKQAIMAFFTGIVCLTLLYVFFWQSNYDLNKMFNPTYVVNYFMADPVTDYRLYLQGADPRMGRARAIVEAVKLIFDNPINAIFGYGSGSTAEASSFNTSGQLFQKVGPLAGLGRNHYSKTIAELGLLGLGGFIVFFVTLYIRIKHFSAASDIKNSLSLLLFTLFLLSTYALTLTSFFFSFTLAFFLATAQAELDRSSHA
jgi:hypothetical protein